MLCSAMLAANVFAVLYLMCQVLCVGFEEQESPHKAQRSLRMSLLEYLWLPHSWRVGEASSHGTQHMEPSVPSNKNSNSKIL